MRDIKYFFQPKSIAIIGASQNFKSINGMLVKYLLKHGYAGDIYPVNPKYEEIAGLKCYPSLTDIDENVDMALIAISAARILPILEQCAAKKVKSVIIYSSGFAEIGAEGRKIQESIKEIAQQEGMVICGPNCLGSINLTEKTVVAFSPVLEEDLIDGSVGFVSQSGAFGFVTFHQAQDEGIGFSYLVTTGNEVDLSIADYIEYMVDDEKTKVALCYMEGMKDGEKFKEVAEKAILADMPIVVLKVGRSSVGQKAIASHTAALAGSDAVYSAFFRQKGVIRVEHSDELIDMAKIFANSRRPKGFNVGILSTSGGAGIMAADTFTQYGLEIPALATDTIKEIEGIIPSFGSAANPVDVTAEIFNSPEYLKKCLQVMVEDDNIDSLLVSLSTVGGELAEIIAKGIAEVYQGTKKPIAVSWGASNKLAGKAFQLLSKAGVPVYKQPVRCAQALSILTNYADYREKYCREAKVVESNTSSTKELLLKKLNSFPDKVLTEDQSKELLSIGGVPTTKESLVKEEEQAVVAALKIGYPVVMKVMSPKILHKTEAGVLAIGVKNEEELRKTYQKIYAKALAVVDEKDINGVSIQEMAPPGTEAIIGVKNDPQFGPTIMFGLGGIFVEALKDVTFKVAPLTEGDAAAMLEEIKGKKILEGFRGYPAIDKKKLIEAILKVSQLAIDLKEEVAEIDLNPILLYPDSVKVVDALIIKKQ